MKKYLKFIVPTIVFALLFSLLLLVPSEAKIEKDVCYATWASEADYLKNPENPSKTYTSNKFTTAAIKSAGYVKCFTNVLNNSVVELPVGCNTIIDLNGYKLTATAKIVVNGSVTTKMQTAGKLTFKNGDIVHTSGQFIQGRSCAEVYFDNVNININGGNNFVTSYALRLLHFNNCTVTVTKNNNIAFELGIGFNATGADSHNNGADYVTNVLFENTVFTDNSTTGKDIFQIPASSNRVGLVNISFGYGSSFNKISDKFLVNKNTNRNSLISFNVSKGARFATEAVPSNANLVTNYYDSITRVGSLLAFGNKTELLPAGEVQNPESPKLIFGYSGNDSLPYQLCEAIYTVNWMSKGELLKRVEYADGLYIDYSAPALGAFFNAEDNNLVYEETHIGWSATEDGTEFVKTILIDGDATYYAGFDFIGPANMAVIDMSDPDNPKPKKAYLNNVIDNDSESFAEGAYVLMYSDIILALDTPLMIPDGVTLDLGGHSLIRTDSVSTGRPTLFLPLGTATVKNGTIKSTLLSAFVVEEDTTLNLDGVTISYSGTPLAYVAGSLNVTNSVIKERGGSPEIPAFILESGTGTIVLDETDITISGILFTTSAKDGFDFDISLTDCDSVKCASLLVIDKNVASAISAPTSVNFGVHGSKVTADKVFNVSYAMDGNTTVNAVYELSQSYFSTNPASSLVGDVELLDGALLAYSSAADYPYMVSAGAVSLSFSMALSQNMTATFYIPVDSALTSVTTNAGTFKTDALTVTKINNVKYYVVDVTGISATSALDSIPLTISFTGEDGNEYTSDINYSPADYFADLLESSDILERRAAASAMRYVSDVYLYTDATLPENFASLLESEAYVSALRGYDDVPPKFDNVDLGNISLAFSGAQLYLSSSIDVRFNLNASFTGTLNVAGNTYSVTEGKVGEASFITVQLSANDLYSTAIAISGTAADGTEIAGSYSLSTYVTRMSAEASPLSNMLKSLHAWCYEAFLHGNGGVLPPTYIDTLPPSDIIWH